MAEEKKSKLPTETRVIRLAPDLAEFVEGLLEPLEGKDLEAAQAAIAEVRQGGPGTSEQLRDRYSLAIDRAIGKRAQT